jgi:hypothetical protein
MIGIGVIIAAFLNLTLQIGLLFWRVSWRFRWSMDLVHRLVVSLRSSQRVRKFSAS